MGRVSAWEDTRQEVADALGTTPDKLPRHDTTEWFALMGKLQESHPDLAQRAREALIESVAPEPLPTHSEIVSEHRRTSVLGWLARWSQRPDPMQPGRTRTNKTAVMLAIVMGTFALIFAFRAHQPTLPQPAAHTRPRQTTPAPQRRIPSTTPTPSPSPPTASPGSSSLPTVSPPPLPPGFPQPSSRAQAGVSGAGGSGTQGDQGGATVVNGQAASSGGARIVAPQAQTGGLVVVPGTAAAAGGGTLGGTVGGGGLQIVTAQAQAQTASHGGNGGAAAATSPTGQAKAPSFQVGDQFTVKMLTPLAVSPAWQAIPAVAQGVDGPLSGWRVLGSASLGRDGSIQISWTQALAPDGKTTVALHGIAYDPQEGKPGIPHAQTQVMAPQVARTVLSGTLGAVSQYVQDQIQAQQAILTNGATFLTSSAPAFWQVAAQQLATGFQPAPVQTGGTIVVSRVQAGTPVVVFITAPSP